ncbi:hypothetical protein QBC44DRAFT_311960 [Cladorrhinum sp. PSN332]|nr:hypothetical protein QBC44DRAFT_311960 [Cladorrhinum sp. PSN332]
MVWMTTRDDESLTKETITDKIRWTMECRLPVKLDFRTDYNLVRISIFLVLPALLASPLLEGALGWTASSEAANSAVARSGNPAAQFYSWSFIASAAGKPGPDDIWDAATLAGMAWENATSSGNSLGDPTEQTHATSRQCRYVITHDQFPTGTKIHNATIPCIIIHDISWPTGPMPSNVQDILDNSNVVSAAGRAPIGRTSPETGILFDATNTSLPTPSVLGSSNGSYSVDTVIVQQPEYPKPFIWSGVMTVIMKTRHNIVFPPYVLDVFGIEQPGNQLTRGATVVLDRGEARPERFYTYLNVNSTAGVIQPAASTYVKQNVTEADDNDPEGRDIKDSPWVKEALYLTSDIMGCVAGSNSTGISSWQNLENYTEAVVRFSYMAAWNLLHRRHEPKRTMLTVDLYEPRLEAVVSPWRVITWLTIWILSRWNAELAGN